MKDWELDLALQDPNDPIHADIEQALREQHGTDVDEPGGRACEEPEGGPKG